jgi:hypothetical protein
MIVETKISYGYLSLIETFFNANELLVVCSRRCQYDPYREFINLEYEDNSLTAVSVTFMSCKHLGFENMLADYLIRCGILPGMLEVGRLPEKRSMKKLEDQWQEHRKLIGLR